MVRPPRVVSFGMCSRCGLPAEICETGGPTCGPGADGPDLDFLGTPGFRARWWTELETIQPEVAARLVAKFPDRYPVPALSTTVDI